MKFIIDTNVLLTFFWKDSVFKKVCLDNELEFFSPEFALEEINKYKEDILFKTGISLKEFKNILEELVRSVEFVPLNEYNDFFRKIKENLKHFSERDFNEIMKDIDFLALSLKLKCPLWSNDNLLKKQNLADVVSTREIIFLLDL